MHELTGIQAFLAGVITPADKLERLYAQHGWIAAEIGVNWNYLSRHVCLTGYAQLALIFLRLFQLTRDARHFSAATKLLDDVARTQDLRDPTAPHFGAIAGSFPIYGRYAPLQYPNWATKFFIDALLAEQAARKKEGAPHPLQSFAG